MSMRALVSPAAASFLPRTSNPSANPSHHAAALSRHPSGGRAVAAATGDHWGADYHHYHGGGRGSESEAEERAGPSVQCDVDVVSWRERRVFASVAVAADVDTVWRVITDYERLADFIPNLVHRSTFLRPLVPISRLSLQNFVLAVGFCVYFELAVGGFRARMRVGYGWNRGGCSKHCIGTSRHASCWISRRSRMPLMVESSTSPWSMVTLRSSKGNGPSDLVQDSMSLNFCSATVENDAISSSKFKEAPPSSGFGGVLASPPSELNSKWGVYGNVCRLDRPCVVDEIHLRRFDGLLEHEGAHRCVFASITVKAPVREVWNVLTAYEKLPEIVPNLAISRIILCDNSKVRILQEGCKGLLYMVLHARVVMDLREKLEHEISFEQVEGDFYSFKGKWRLEQLGDQHTLLKYMVETKMRKDTFLSESILEEVIYEDLASNLCAIRDYVEKAEAESSNSTTHSVVPTNPDTVAIDYTEGRQSEQAYVSCPSNSTKQRPKVPGLQKDIEVLKSELESFIAKYGQDGFMPKRKHLRSHGRVDIEKAITRMGGFRKIASIMNLSLSYKNRKPRGYWDNLENLQEEIMRFQKNWGMDPSCMPSRKSFERAGRYDIARALEKWGGVQEVSRLLSLELRRPRRRADSDDERQSESPCAVTNKHRAKPDKPNVAPQAEGSGRQLGRILNTTQEERMLTFAHDLLIQPFSEIIWRL